MPADKEGNSTRCVSPWPMSALRVAFGAIWSIDATLKWLPGFRATYMSTIMGIANGQPAWLKPWFRFWVDLQHPRTRRGWSRAHRALKALPEGVASPVSASSSARWQTAGSVSCRARPFSRVHLSSRTESASQPGEQPSGGRTADVDRDVPRAARAAKEER
jgi:hypothetical protein